MYSEWEWHVMIKKGDQISLQIMLDAVGKNIVDELNTKIFKNETLLTTAIKGGFPDIVQLLLIHGADPNIKSSENGRNEPPLLTATRLKNFEIVKLLLQHRADPTHTGFYGHDATFQAVIENTFDILEHFLQIPILNRPSHPPQNCPVRVAFKYAIKSPCKRKCLLMLLQYGYSCGCIQMGDNTDNLHFSCAEVLTFVHSIHPKLVFNLPLSLFNLTRCSIRRHILKNNQVTNGENLYTSILQLPLPSKLKQALVLKDYINYEVRNKTTSSVEIIHYNLQTS